MALVRADRPARFWSWRALLHSRKVVGPRWCCGSSSPFLALATLLHSDDYLDVNLIVHFIELNQFFHNTFLRFNYTRCVTLKQTKGQLVYLTRRQLNFRFTFYLFFLWQCVPGEISGHKWNDTLLNTPISAMDSQLDEQVELNFHNDLVRRKQQVAIKFRDNLKTTQITNSFPLLLGFALTEHK